MSDIEVNAPIEKGKKKLGESIKRFYEIDTIKGVAVILMVIFHFFYLANEMGVNDYNVSGGLLYSAAKIAHVTFIFMVGINLTISYLRYKEKKKNLKEEELNNSYNGKQFKRGLFLIGAGMIMTLLSYLAFKDKYIKFGILHFIGVAVILSIFIVKDKHLALIASAIVGLLYAILNNSALKNAIYDKCQEFPMGCFISGVANVRYTALDHFSLIPYFGLLSFGIFIGHLLYNSKSRNFITTNKRNSSFEKYKDNVVIKGLSTLGKNSFKIYFTHFLIFYFVLVFYKRMTIYTREEEPIDYIHYNQPKGFGKRASIESGSCAPSLHELIKRELEARKIPHLIDS